MSRRDDIIADEETDAGEGITLDENFDAGVDGLCDGDTCRHSECDCWNNFKFAVRHQLERQKAEMREVTKCCNAEVYDDGEFCVECGKPEPDLTWVPDEMKRMYRLYKAEVSYGLHKPKSAEERNLQIVQEI